VHTGDRALLLLAARRTYRYADIARAERRVKPKRSSSYAISPFTFFRTSDIRSPLAARRCCSVIASRYRSRYYTSRGMPERCDANDPALRFEEATEDPFRLPRDQTTPPREFIAGEIIPSSGTIETTRGEKALRGGGRGRRPLAIKHGVSPALRG